MLCALIRWGVRTALIAIISFFPTKGDGAVGSIDSSQEAREKLAKASKNWACSICGSSNATCLPDETQVSVSKLEQDPEFKVKFTVQPSSSEMVPSASNDRGENTPPVTSVYASPPDESLSNPTFASPSSASPSSSLAVAPPSPVRQPATNIDQNRGLKSRIETLLSVLVGLLVLLIAHKLTK